MFKLEVYSARTLNAIPPFEGPARRAERAEAAPEPTAAVETAAIEKHGQGIRAFSGGARTRGPARGSN